MKVFISWSGEPSRSIARALHGWLPLVVQHVDAWMSDEEIVSGGRWSDAVAASLDSTNFGVICVTSTNQDRPWLVFEAGALAKRLDVARVVPLCIDLPPAQVAGPLAAFQGRCLDKDGIRRLVQDIWVTRDQPPMVDVDSLFEAMWPALESKVVEAKVGTAAAPESRRSTTELLEELLDRVRRIERNQQMGSSVRPTRLPTLVDRNGVIINLASAGQSEVEIAKRLGQSVTTVRRVLNRYSKEQAGDLAYPSAAPEGFDGPVGLDS